MTGAKSPIPEQFRPKETDRAQFSKAFHSAMNGIGAGDPAVLSNQDTLKRQEEALTLHNLSMTAAANGQPGMRALVGAAAALAKTVLQQVEQKKKDEERDRETVKRSLEALQEHLRWLDEQIAATDEKIEAAEQLQRLLLTGKFDPEDKDDYDLAIRAGYTPDQISDDSTFTPDKVDDHVDALHRQRDDYQRQRNSTANEIEAQEVSNTASPETRQATIDALRKQNVFTVRQQADLEVKSDVEDTSLYESKIEISESIQTTEQEIADFSRKLAETKSISNDVERLSEQKRLIDALSEDAQMIASFDPEAEQLFVEGYFERLNQQSEQQLTATPNVAPGLLA